MTARGATRSLQGQDERNRMMVNNIDPTIELLVMVKPDVSVVAHTATSYYLGGRGGVDLLARLERSTGRRIVTVFGSVVRALEPSRTGSGEAGNFERVGDDVACASSCWSWPVNPRLWVLTSLS